MAGHEGADTVRHGPGTAVPPLGVAGWALLVLAGAALFFAGFLGAWRHVRLSPALVDQWPGGAVGFGLSCAVAVLAGWAGTYRFLRGAGPGAGTRTAPDGGGAASVPGSGRRLAAAGGSVALGLLGALYGLAVVPPRWCYRSTSPRCAELPGAAEAGIAFLGTLILAFFLHGAVAALARQVSAAYRERAAHGRARSSRRP